MSETKSKTTTFAEGVVRRADGTELATLRDVRATERETTLDIGVVTERRIFGDARVDSSKLAGQEHRHGEAFRLSLSKPDGEFMGAKVDGATLHAVVFSSFSWAKGEDARITWEAIVAADGSVVTLSPLSLQE